MRYAVSLSDLMRFKGIHPVRLLLRPVLTRETVVVRSGDLFDNIGLLLREDVGPDRCEAIIEVVRLKVRKYVLAFYKSKTGKGNWKRV